MQRGLSRVTGCSGVMHHDPPWVLNTKTWRRLLWTLNNREDTIRVYNTSDVKMKPRRKPVRRKVEALGFSSRELIL